MITKWSHQKYNAHTLPFAEERDAPDVAPLDKGGLDSQIRNENFDEGSGGDLGGEPARHPWAVSGDQGGAVVTRWLDYPRARGREVTYVAHICESQGLPPRAGERALGEQLGIPSRDHPHACGRPAICHPLVCRLPRHPRPCAGALWGTFLMCLQTLHVGELWDLPNDPTEIRILGRSPPGTRCPGASPTTKPCVSPEEDEGSSSLRSC
jgi:hypothetical protein